MSLPRASDLLGRLPAVCFTAEDLAIVRGEPSARRTFMDTELCQLHIGYLDHVGQYKRCLEQRNALLRLAQDSWVPEEEFEPWEQQMGHHGSQIRHYRRRWVGELASRAAEMHGELADGEPLGLRYSLQDEHEDPQSLRSHLSTSRPLDLRRGSTSIGPHRDDLVLEVAGREARSYGSQGQQRTAVIALKLAVQRVAQEHLGYPPVLLLDDVFSDLDAGRRANLVCRAMGEGGQVFLTCTEVGQAEEGIAGQAKLFRVQSGRAEEG
jgi:DNA replication and repair protein RecF